MPFKASPRSVGFRVSQAGSWTVEVWWQPGADDDQSVAEAAYAALRDELLDDFDVERHPGPGYKKGILLVTRLREPTEKEWAALDAVAGHPLDCTRDHGADGVPADTAQLLMWSGLMVLLTYPLVRRHVYDPQQGTMPALSTNGRRLLEDRIAHEAWERATGVRPAPAAPSSGRV
ncbi:hypothetical protein ACWC9T_38505 [Kitasatospora sp. NPDC001159]